MADYDQTPENSALPGFLRMLRRRAVLILLCAVAVAGGALAISLTQQKKYSASALLLFRQPGFDQSISGTPFFAPSSDPRRDAATNAKLVSLPDISARTARTIGGGLTQGKVQSEIEVSAQGQSDIVAVKATDPSPQLATKMANTFAQQYIAFRRDADRAKIIQARDLSRRELAQLPKPEQDGRRGRSLQQRIDQLDAIAAVQTGNAELVQPGQVPSVPSSPRPLRNTIFGAIAGLLLGLGLAALAERLDRRIREPKELETYFRRPVLAAVPASKALARSGPAPNALPPEEAEAFRMLRANLRYFNVDSEVRSVLVTSAAPGEGKSTVACNLAAAAADAGMKVLLLEADLRRPTVARSLGIKPGPGITHMLAGESELADVVQQVPSRAQGAATHEFDVVVCGPLPPNPTDLIESDRMRSIIKSAESEYELVVIDTPPTTVVSDAIPLIPDVDGVIVVGRLGRSTRDAAQHLSSQLENLNAPLLGVVVNDLGRDSTGYGAYGYGAYGYGAYAAAPEAAVSAPPIEVKSNGHAPASDGDGADADRARDAVASRVAAGPAEQGDSEPESKPAPASASQWSVSDSADSAPAPRRRGGLLNRIGKRPQ